MHVMIFVLAVHSVAGMDCTHKIALKRTIPDVLYISVHNHFLITSPNSHQHSPYNIVVIYTCLNPDYQSNTCTSPGLK